jgi:hypothetical protein
VTAGHTDHFNHLTETPGPHDGSLVTDNILVQNGVPGFGTLTYGGTGLIENIESVNHSSL